MDLLAESDAAAVTSRGIADRAGLSLDATTYHFGSTPEIIEVAYQQIIDLALG